MKQLIALFAFITLIHLQAFSQDTKFSIFNKIMGEWNGKGSGFGNSKSVIKSSFTFVMDSMYIKVINDSKFEASEMKPKGEHHMDWGMISYDKSRDLFIFRQFNIEGFVNQYVLNISKSSKEKLVFETESIENLPQGNARWTINIIDDQNIETIFDVSFPGDNYSCFGTNTLRKEN